MKYISKYCKFLFNKYILGKNYYMVEYEVYNSKKFIFEGTWSFELWSITESVFRLGKAKINYMFK